MIAVYLLAGTGAFLLIGGSLYAYWLYREEKKQHKGPNVKGKLL